MTAHISRAAARNMPNEAAAFRDFQGRRRGPVIIQLLVRQ